MRLSFLLPTANTSLLACTLTACSLGMTLGVGAVGCGSESGDPHSADGVVPSPTGRDKRIRDVANPSSADHPNNNDNVTISGSSVVVVDTYDETGDGKSSGAVYVQDIDSTEPYSGIGLYSPTFQPGNLRIGAGDVLDLVGAYQETAVIQSTPPVVFAPGAILPQLFRPVATLRYDSKPLEPRDIDVDDLANFDKARQWIGMLVRVRNVTVSKAVAPETLYKGRLGVDLATPTTPNEDRGCSAPFPKAPTLVNELFAAETLNIPANTTIKSVTGVVTFFCNIHLAPRSAADVEL